MQSLALIVNQDSAQNTTLTNYISAGTELECSAITSVPQLRQWLAQSDRKADVLLLSWQFCWDTSGLLQELRESPPTRNAMLYVVIPTDAYEWIQSSSVASDLVDHFLVKPFRVRTLVQRIERSLRGPVTASSAALIVDEDGASREIIHDCLGSIGFLKIVEVPTTEEAISILKRGSQELSVVVTTWEVGGAQAFNLQREILRSPKLAGTPLLMITSQLSIDQIKFVQEIPGHVKGFIQTPLESRALRGKIVELAEKLEVQRAVLAAQEDARTRLAQGSAEGAVEALERAVAALPGCASLFETLGDLQRGRTDGVLAAIGAYDRALKLEPSRPGLAAKYAESQIAAGRIQDGIRVLKSHLYRFGFDDALRTELGKIYLQSGDYGAAAVELRRALNTNPANQSAQGLLQVASSLETKRAA